MSEPEQGGDADALEGESAKPDAESRAEGIGEGSFGGRGLELLEVGAEAAIEGGW